jgi:hypothetical protein
MPEPMEEETHLLTEVTANLVILLFVRAFETT